MTGEFPNLFYQLTKHRAEIALQKHNLSILTAGDFEIDRVEYENFNAEGLSVEWVIKSLTQDSKADEAEIQLQFVASAFARLQRAMDVIEAQMALGQRIEEFSALAKDKSALRQCLKADHYAVRGLYDQIEILRDYQKKKNLPRVADEESMMDGLTMATLRYRAINDGKISDKFNALSATELTDALYQARLGYADHAVHDIGRTLDKTHNSIRAATLIEVSVRHKDGLVSDEFLKNMQIASLKYAHDRVMDAEFIVGRIEEFLYSMNGGENGASNYRYATINGLDQLAP